MSVLAITPIDGRYAGKVEKLANMVSEYALIKNRLRVEIEWLISLSDTPHVPEVPHFSSQARSHLRDLLDNFTPEEAERVKEYERTTNHDVKAVEYYLKANLGGIAELWNSREFVHFCCTSEDINNLAYAWMLREGRDLLLERVRFLMNEMKAFAIVHRDLPMLARTHGQPASPTTLGKEFAVFAKRLEREMQTLSSVKIQGKMNGATGNYNAHMVTHPHLDWEHHTRRFISKMGICQLKHTTQIEPHDYVAEMFHALERINTILIDFSRDVWSYISIGYFTQRVIEGETGSSTMPHKVNPIDFENAEGNLGLANAILHHMASKLPISRWQRDLTDSTVLRNVGVGFAYSLIAYTSLEKGLGKIKANEDAIQMDLQNMWEILAEPIQMVMRQHGIENPYEQLKKLTRGKSFSGETLVDFITGLDLPDDAKTKLLGLSPLLYTGLASKLADDI